MEGLLITSALVTAWFLLPLIVRAAMVILRVPIRILRVFGNVLKDLERKYQ